MRPAVVIVGPAKTAATNLREEVEGFLQKVAV